MEKAVLEGREEKRRKETTPIDIAIITYYYKSNFNNLTRQESTLMGVGWIDVHYFSFYCIFFIDCTLKPCNKEGKETTREKLQMKRISKKQYEAISKDYRGVWEGKRTVFAGCLGFSGLGTRLAVEGVDFEVIG